MRVSTLIFREISQRWFNFGLSVLAVLLAVTLFISSFTVGPASKAETTRLMRNLGFNLRVIPKKTDMDCFWKAGFSNLTIPESHVYKSCC